MRLSHYSSFSDFDLFGIVQRPFFGQVSNLDLKTEPLAGPLKSAQKPLKSFKPLIMGQPL